MYSLFALSRKSCNLPQQMKHILLQKNWANMLNISENIDDTEMFFTDADFSSYFLLRLKIL